MHETLSSCRSCDAPDLEHFLSLGDIPLMSGFLDGDSLGSPEPRYPLNVGFCPRCSLVQLLETVPAETLFADNPAYASFADAVLAHARDNAHSLIASQDLDGDSLVVEPGSNDGYMLRNFTERSIPAVGIDPAEGPAAAAEKLGIVTMREFFGARLAAQLVGEGKQADVVIANNVLNEVPDLNDFVEGIAILLRNNGLAVIEVPYVRDLIDLCEFDTIYHEHLCYFSASALVELFRRHNLSVNHIEQYPIHGGSLRLYVAKQVKVRSSVSELLRQEAELGVLEAGYYRDFAGAVRDTQRELVGILREAKHEGRRIAAYGATAKGTILLNSSGIGVDLIDYVVDRNVHKQGRFMPGVHIPVYDPAKLLEELPDYVVLLSWTFKDEVLSQQEEYRNKGGRFVIPIPTPTVV